jgi:hypothetical protein
MYEQETPFDTPSPEERPMRGKDHIEDANRGVRLMTGYKLHLTDHGGNVIDSWDMDDELDRSLFHEFAGMTWISTFAAKEIKRQLATYDD